MKIFARYARFQSHCFSITKSVSNVFTFIAQSYVDYLCGKADVCDYGGAQHSKGKSGEFFLSSSSFVKAMLNEI